MGRLRFFNDATFGIAPDLVTLRDYAARFYLYPCSLRLGESGYVRLEGSHAVVVFDAAPLGPDYQPGHGHADTLSFELSYNGQRVLVNSGTSTYEQNSIREYERGTAAHNTVRIDHADQSEMWAAFRVARRARPLGVRTDGTTFVEASHDGYRRLRPGVTHHRRLEIDDEMILVSDRIEGRGHHSVEVFFHFAPGALADLQMDPKLSCSTECGTYSTGWNLRVPNRVLVGRWQGQCPVQFFTRMALGSVRFPEMTEPANR